MLDWYQETRNRGISTSATTRSKRWSCEHFFSVALDEFEARAEPVTVSQPNTHPVTGSPGSTVRDDEIRAFRAVNLVLLPQHGIATIRSWKGNVRIPLHRKRCRKVCAAGATATFRAPRSGGPQPIAHHRHRRHYHLQRHHPARHSIQAVTTSCRLKCSPREDFPSLALRSSEKRASAARCCTSIRRWITRLDEIAADLAKLVKAQPTRAGSVRSRESTSPCRFFALSVTRRRGSAATPCACGTHRTFRCLGRSPLFCVMTMTQRRLGEGGLLMIGAREPSILANVRTTGQWVAR